MTPEPRYQPLNLKGARAAFRNLALTLVALAGAVMGVQWQCPISHPVWQLGGLFGLLTVAFVVPVLAFGVLVATSLERRSLWLALWGLLTAIGFGMLTLFLTCRVWMSDFRF
ncbi:MAG: hypothetical protein KF861_16370 [Planctomycetaceae bacterium]|nr:hypothetical protein [Planctomycetaceae bacterium]